MGARADKLRAVLTQCNWADKLDKLGRGELRCAQLLSAGEPVAELCLDPRFAPQAH